MRRTEATRILFAVSSLSAGGAERMIAELANAFAESGSSVAVLTWGAATTDHHILRTEIERLALDLIWDSVTSLQSIASNFRRSRAIRRAVRQFRPDVVVSFVEMTNVRMLAALAGTGLPVIVSERTNPRHYQLSGAWNWVRRLLYPWASAVVVQSESVAQWAREFVAARRVHVLPNFVRDLPPASSIAERSSNEILAVGRLSREKGFDLLLRAFAASGLSERGVRLTILGEGPERQALMSLARVLGVENVVSMPGVVRDPEKWMAGSAAFVLPSRYEGFPNALLEAMAMGCAVIATDCDSGPRQIIRNGVDGVLVPLEDVAALAEALRTVLSDPDLRMRLSFAALSVRQRFEKKVILERWRALLGEVLSR